MFDCKRLDVGTIDAPRLIPQECLLGGFAFSFAHAACASAKKIDLESGELLK